MFYMKQNKIINVIFTNCVPSTDWESSLSTESIVRFHCKLMEILGLKLAKIYRECIVYQGPSTCMYIFL